MAKIKLGTTLSGSIWIEKITELFSIDGRFARGKTYFNKGYIKQFSLDDGYVESRIKGSHGSYYTDFEFHSDDEAKAKIISYFHANPLSQSSILNGELSQSFFDWCESEKITLFIEKKHMIQGIHYPK